MTAIQTARSTARAKRPALAALFYSLTAVIAGMALALSVTPAYAADEPPAVTYAIPKIVGTVKVGSTLTASPGAWDAAATLNYQWVVGNVDVFGATSTTYAVLPVDAGKTIAVRITGTRDGYTPTTATSALTAKAALGTFSRTRPAIAGTVRVGQTLTATTGTWSPAPTFSYQWYRNSSAIENATSATYVATSADYSRTLYVKVTARSDGYTSSAYSSVRTAKVGKGILVGTTPTIVGTPQVGKTLAASPGLWSPTRVSFTYLWYIDGVAVKGATKSTYTVPSSALNRTLTVRVTGAKSYYTTKGTRSIISDPVILGDITAPAPTIAGTPAVGHTLTATTTGWTSSVLKTFQWNRDGVPIAGATAATYKPTEADHGFTLTVLVDGTRSAYNPVSVISTTTPAIAYAFSSVPTPTITGTLKSGFALTANPRTWVPAPETYSYLWRRDGSAIAGATGDTFALTANDEGHRISVTITGTSIGYLAASSTSSKTASIVRGPVMEIRQDAASAFAELNAWRATQGLRPYAEYDPIRCAFRESAFGSGSDATPAAVIIGSHTAQVMLDYPAPRWTAAVWVEEYVSASWRDDIYIGRLKVYECGD